MKCIALKVMALFCLLLQACNGGGTSPPLESFAVSPRAVAPGGSATLRWSSGAAQCQASGSWSGVKEGSGSEVVTPPDDNGVYGYTLNCSGSSGASFSGSTSIGVAPSAGKIEHVVIIFQENRTPDNLFHGLSGADIANTGVNSEGQIITLQPVPLANNYDLGHGHVDFLLMYDRGKMDGADKVPATCISGAHNCPPANPQFRYVDPADVQPYFSLAQTYAFADRMFQTNQGPSFEAHQYIISGTSEPEVGSQYLVADGPANANDSGCSASADVTVNLIDPLGNEKTTAYPCFEHPTLIDLLDAAGLGWRYYAFAEKSIWTGPNAIRHLRFGSDWNNVIIPQSQVLMDIATGQLKTVTWVIPNNQDSDHAIGNNGTGPSWVASVVNAIGNSPFWDNTAIFLTWDDWGGWYDHVPPQIYNSYEYGFRVPLIIISPYAKSGYVSHATHDFGSILKFTEETYGLPSLGYADARADDLMDSFDFGQNPTQYKTISSKYDAHYFLTDTSQPTVPDDY